MAWFNCYWVHCQAAALKALWREILLIPKLSDVGNITFTAIMVPRTSKNVLIFRTEYNVRCLRFYQRCVNICVFGDVMLCRWTGNKLPFGKTIMSPSSESNSLKGHAPFFDWFLKMEELRFLKSSPALRQSTWSHIPKDFSIQNATAQKIILDSRVYLLFFLVASTYIPTPAI